MNATPVCAAERLEDEHRRAERRGELQRDGGQQVERRDDAAQRHHEDQPDQCGGDREDQLEIVVDRVADVGEDGGVAGDHRGARRRARRRAPRRAAGRGRCPCRAALVDSTSSARSMLRAAAVGGQHRAPRRCRRRRHAPTAGASARARPALSGLARSGRRPAAGRSRHAAATPRSRRRCGSPASTGRSSRGRSSSSCPSADGRQRDQDERHAERRAARPAGDARRRGARRDRRSRSCIQRLDGQNSARPLTAAIAGMNVTPASSITRTEIAIDGPSTRNCPNCAIAERRERGDDGQRGRRDDRDRRAAAAFAAAVAAVLPGAQALADAEEQEQEVVDADADEHDGDQLRRAGVQLEAEGQRGERRSGRSAAPPTTMIASSGMIAASGPRKNSRLEAEDGAEQQELGDHRAGLRSPW